MNKQQKTYLKTIEANFPDMRRNTWLESLQIKQIAETDKRKLKWQINPAGISTVEFTGKSGKKPAQVKLQFDKPIKLAAWVLRRMETLDKSKLPAKVKNNARKRLTALYFQLVNATKAK